jgi:hypothetical protein
MKKTVAVHLTLGRDSQFEKQKCSTVEKRNKFRKLETEKVGGRHRGALEFNIKSTPSVGACFVD